MRLTDAYFAFIAAFCFLLFCQGIGWHRSVRSRSYTKAERDHSAKMAARYHFMYLAYNGSLIAWNVTLAVMSDDYLFAAPVVLLVPLMVISRVNYTRNRSVMRLIDERLNFYELVDRLREEEEGLA